MTVLGHFRRSQRLIRSVFAVFVLAWLQTALLPCAMAVTLNMPVTLDMAATVELPAHSQTQTLTDAQQAAMADMPDCVYCPPKQADAVSAVDACLYPDAPQVDGAHQQFQQLHFYPVFFGSSFNIALEPDIAAPRARYLQPPIPRRSLALTYCVQLK